MSALSKIPHHLQDFTHCHLAAIEAYARTFQIPLQLFDKMTANRVVKSLAACAVTDTQAAHQMHKSLERLHHDKTTLDATDGLPLILVAPGDKLRFYFSRPPQGWPRPGHRHPHF